MSTEKTFAGITIARQPVNEAEDTVLFPDEREALRKRIAKRVIRQHGDLVLAAFTGCPGYDIDGTVQSSTVEPAPAETFGLTALAALKADLHSQLRETTMLPPRLLGGEIAVKRIEERAQADAPALMAGLEAVVPTVYGMDLAASDAFPQTVAVVGRQQDGEFKIERVIVIDDGEEGEK